MAPFQPDCADTTDGPSRQEKVPKMKIARWTRFTKGLLATAFWKARGVIIADRVVVDGRIPSIGPDGELILGSRVSFRGKRLRSRLGVWKNAKLVIGDRTFINSGAVIESTTSVTIGSNCLIGDRVTIQDCDYHEVEEGAGVRHRPVKIGDSVWLGNGATVLPGVEIGDYSVIGAGAVVTKSVPARVLAAGNPARVIRDLKVSDGYRR